ncbi:hypothetical protein F5Y12DRAFT_714041 [Xylaria sp. FL1777]|nr:hypothetical protein F5Y12DRAFT_714041 [Xylaria sp. FL1777]
MVLQTDTLGEMFTSEEKRILRNRDPEQQAARVHLILRLADAFTFRRAPRFFIPSLSGCSGNEDVVEDVDISRCQLPAMSKDENAKALCSPLMEQRMALQVTPSIMSGLNAKELNIILNYALDVWTRNGKVRNLERIIDSIPQNILIKKVVCIGLSEIAVRYGERDDIIVMSQSLAQHLAVLSMVRYLRNTVPHEVKLFAADWTYDAAHNTALESLGFKILNAYHGYQEHFLEIDDNTMLISFGIAECESILPIISEYARPVAMIYDAYDYQINEDHPRPSPTPVWSKVKHKEEWVTVPGPPAITREASVGYSTAASLTSMSPRLPFYTESTGKMLDSYKIAMNLFDLDVTGLPSLSQLHIYIDSRRHPESDYKLADLDEIEQKRFAGRRSRLFVRK